MKPTVYVDIPMLDEDQTKIEDIVEDPVTPDDPEPVEVEIAVDAPPSPKIDPTVVDP